MGVNKKIYIFWNLRSCILVFWSGFRAAIVSIPWERRQPVVQQVITG